MKFHIAQSCNTVIEKFRKQKLLVNSIGKKLIVEICAPNYVKVFMRKFERTYIYPYIR